MPTPKTIRRSIVVGPGSGDGFYAVRLATNVLDACVRVDGQPPRTIALNIGSNLSASEVQALIDSHINVEIKP